MGRKPSKPGAIPRFRARRQKSGAVHFYYDHGGKPRRETPLGSDYGLAIKRWAELEHASDLPPPAILLFRHVAEAYRREVIPTKAPRTQRDNMVELANLLAFFDDPPAPFEAIEPQHVKKYIRWRKAAPVRAQREKALLSHIWNWSAEEGYTALPNPCALVKAKGGSRGRKVYIEDDQFKAVWEKADACLRDLMDFAYLTGQRPGDCITFSETQIRDGVLHFKQSKTGARVPMEVRGELEQLIERIRKRKASAKVHSLRLMVNEFGRPVGLHAWSNRWRNACNKAGVAGIQLRDLRAKAATDKTESSGDIRQAQKQLGHSNVTTTEGYVRNRRGEKVTPTR
jgi:integrase